MKLQKDTISLWAFILKRVFILSSIASKIFGKWLLTGNGRVSAQNTVIAVNWRWEQDIQGKRH